MSTQVSCTCGRMLEFGADHIKETLYCPDCGREVVSPEQQLAGQSQPSQAPTRKRKRTRLELGIASLCLLTLFGLIGAPVLVAVQKFQDAYGGMQ